MLRAVRFRVIGVSEIACLKFLTKTGLLERSLIMSDLEKSLENTEDHCFVEHSYVMIVATLLV